jgi:tRNA(Arg) A34 adenosine deaminase TadA
MDVTYMQKAIQIAEQNSTPFGACLVNLKGQELLAANHVSSTKDSTQHAEIVALQKMAQDKSFSRKGLSIYSTGEPCPMCASALVWAGVQEIYWGLSIAELAQFGNQINVSSNRIFEASWLPIKSQGNILKSTCLTLIQSLKK